jgi:hypothetical protein
MDEREARATTDGDDRARGKLASEREGAGGREDDPRANGRLRRPLQHDARNLRAQLRSVRPDDDPRRAARRARGVSTSPFAVGASQRGAHGLRRFRGDSRGGADAEHLIPRAKDAGRHARVGPPRRCVARAALPPRARPGNIALAESNNDRLGLRLTPPPRPRSLPDRALLTAEASAFLQSVAGAGSGGGEAGKSFTMSRPRPPPIPFPRPGPPRRALSEEEMEAVMLGGATD